jgi:hypothetical protein
MLSAVGFFARLLTFSLGALIEAPRAGLGRRRRRIGSVRLRRGQIERRPLANRA